MLNEASHKITMYLRQGASINNNFHTDDGYVEVKLLIQLPWLRLHKPHPIDTRCIELIPMLIDSRIEADPTATRVRAKQGHTMPTFKLENLYTEITGLAQFNNHPMWSGDTPDHLVVELHRERELHQWARLGIHAPNRKQVAYDEGCTKQRRPEHRN